jgi:outer membrane protein OmpA-like peptidoglycan-associated protein
MQLKPAGKIVVFLVVVGVAVGAVRMFKPDLISKIMPSRETQSSVVPAKVDLPTASSAEASSIKDLVIPADDIGCQNDPEVRLLGYAWNAQMGMLFAAGGPQATKGSLMCKHGVNFKFDRQDDNGKLQEALVAFATELKGGNQQPTKGANFVCVMGDGSASFLKGLNDTLVKLGPDYKAKVVGSIGYSRGEDKFMGPKAWRDDPNTCRGGVVAGVIRDGDWNIAQKWLGDNGLPTNPDEKTYDPDALNWVNANDYLDAAAKYITGYSEDRPVVHNGKRTGETKRITVNAVVTWTPGDVNVATQKGGIVPIVSTREYASQMPAVIIGIDKWMKDNRTLVEEMLQAIAEGGDAVKASSQALQKAAEVSAKVYNDKDSGPDFWEKYYKGVEEPDKTGVNVSLGGSYADNLADSLTSFGLVSGSANLFAATYTVFGNIVAKQYPNLMPSVPPVSDIMDPSYYEDLAKKSAPSSNAVAAATPTFSSAPKHLTRVISSKIWRIPFATGRASFSPAAKTDLDKLRQDLLVASATAVEIHGHTDNQGDPAKNMQLSEARAFAVAHWLEKAFPKNFPEGRIHVYAHGEEQPLQPNSTSAGRAANRRVEVKIGTTD